MKKKLKSRGDYSPQRVYDKSSGEYRPVAGSNDGGGGNDRNARYMTPQRRADTRKRRRRHALILFYIITFIIVIAAAVVVSLTVLFKIDTIQVMGTSRYSSEEIINVTGIKKGENLFLAKTKQASASVVQKLPYIASAKVTRRLPAQIFIEVKEEVVSGAILYQGKYATVSATGKVLEIASIMPKNCPSIKGLELTKAEVGKTIVYKQASQQTMFNSLTSAISENRLDKITSIDVSLPSKILIIYDNRITMNLGLPSDFDYKIRFAKSILDAGKIKSNEKGTLNLSTAAEDDNAFFDPNPTAGSAVTSKAEQNSSK